MYMHRPFVIFSTSWEECILHFHQWLHGKNNLSNLKLHVVIFFAKRHRLGVNCMQYFQRVKFQFSNGDVLSWQELEIHSQEMRARVSAPHFKAQWCVINPDLNLTFFGYKVTWIVRSTSSTIEIKWNLIYEEHFVISELNKSACVCYLHCSSVNHLSFLNCETHCLQFSPDLVKVTRGCIMQIPI